MNKVFNKADMAVNAKQKIQKIIINLFLPEGDNFMGICVTRNRFGTG